MRQVEIRTVIDLVRNPLNAGRFGLFLGAGCSVGAGIPAADEIRLLLDRELKGPDQGKSYAQTVTGLSLVAPPETDSVTHDEERYARCLDRSFKTKDERRDFLEGLFAHKSPSPAHWTLANLVSSGMISRIYTTNFDDLIERSVGTMVDLRVVQSFEHTTYSASRSAPVLYRLHGDYLFEGLSTATDGITTQSSQAVKIADACSRGGLIVVGYSGRDESVMEVLTAAKRSEGGLDLYWLVRNGEQINERVKNLIDSSPSCFLCVMDGFDSFVASLNDASTRSQATTRAIRQMTDARGIFVAHDDGVRKTISRLTTALADESSSVVCLSGLPGAGKTATIRHILEGLSESYIGLAVISAKDRTLTSADVVDECFLQLQIGVSNSDAGDDSRERLMDYFGRTRCLLVIDNADEVDPSVFELLGRVPRPTQVLVTIRDARRLRFVVPGLWEVEHAGLIKSEMAELVNLWMRRSPLLERKIGNASAADIERLLIASNGWPEAMIIMLTTLSNTLLRVDEVEGRVKQDVYDFILGGLYSGLSRSERQCLICAGNFPLTFTPEGLSAVSGLSVGNMKRSLGLLISANLIKELQGGQFTWAHPIVRDFMAVKSKRLDKDGSREAEAFRHLANWAAQYGGQPRADWSNFAELDKEFENLKVLMERTFADREYVTLTNVYRNLFSYIVERGYWTFTEAWCERMIDEPLRRAERADWLIWWSWIKYYLRQNYVESANLAEQALEQNPRQNRLRFEAHRRALVAYGRTGNAVGVSEHQEAAAKICRRTWNRDSDEAIDLLNSEAAAYLALGGRLKDQGAVDHASSLYRRAEIAAKGRSDPNSREVGIAMLGQASCMAVFGRENEKALDLAQRTLAYAWKVSWLRGIVESNELVASLADRMGNSDLATSARDVAKLIGSRLRPKQIRENSKETDNG
ncbi:SIR2 family protein [Dactylosporangium sp. NPDC051541]|uniref:SIR2 family protein n=1 Tax=Dactylosporangium sp. NPDC051541 TaxID=3363977 RepID=UPI0037BC69A7